MITGQLKTDIDRLWTEFWTGGIANPLTVIEQISFLMFARLLDIEETRHEKKTARAGGSPHRYFRADQQRLRWSNWRNLGGEEMLKFVRDEVFPHLRDLGGAGTTFGEYMKDASLMVSKPSLLVSAVTMIEALPLTNTDIKGDLYEYMLSKLTTAGINGQFRTPRHIIRLMVELLEPKPTDIVADPACGTAGFLVEVMQYLLRRYTSPEMVVTLEDGSKSYAGDLLEPYREHIQGAMFHGFDFDATMLRIAAMNLMLHGVENPDIHYMDTLSKGFPEKFPAQAVDGVDVILANPPFKGSLDEADVHPSLLSRVKTKKTELLFVTLILRMLRVGGRAAVIVPDGVLFGSSKAHVALRRLLIEENQLEAVISLPSGVFKPYAGVSTAILVFTKTNGGGTDYVWFYDAETDGWSLDDKRTPLLSEDKLGPIPNAKLSADEHVKNNLPDVLARWRDRSHEERKRPRTAQSFCVNKADIAGKGYDLALNRYKEVVHEPIKHRAPKEIITDLAKLEEEIQRGMKELEGLLK